MNRKILTASKVLSIAMIGGALLLSNCKGDDGAIGPKGEDGNANVMYSEWITATNFKDSTYDGSQIKVGHIIEPKITTDIVTKGTVIMYMTFGSGTNLLPYVSAAGGKANTISFWAKVGQLVPYRFTHDNTNSVNLSSQLQYRYIIIPANAQVNPPAGPGRVAAPDYSDYEAVCKYYGIPL